MGLRRVQVRGESAAVAAAVRGDCWVAPQAPGLGWRRLPEHSCGTPVPSMHEGTGAAVGAVAPILCFGVLDRRVPCKINQSVAAPPEVRGVYALELPPPEAAEAGGWAPVIGAGLFWRWSGVPDVRHAGRSFVIGRNTARGRVGSRCYTLSPEPEGEPEAGLSRSLMSISRLRIWVAKNGRACLV